MFSPPGAMTRAGWPTAKAVPGSGVGVNVGVASGAGVAVAFPLVFSAAANKPGLAQAHSVAAISALAYSGFLMGPPILGWFAQATSLRVMFGVIAGLCALVIFIADAVNGAGVVTEEVSVNPD